MVLCGVVLLVVCFRVVWCGVVSGCACGRVCRFLHESQTCTVLVDHAAARCHTTGTGVQGELEAHALSQHSRLGQCTSVWLS